jgi:hypothetical protein
MALTIQLTPTEEERLEQAAKRQGLPAAELARQLLSIQLPPVSLEKPSSTETSTNHERDPELVARVRRLRGKFAALTVHAEDLHRERHGDKEKEERQIQGHNP